MSKLQPSEMFGVKVKKAEVGLEGQQENVKKAEVGLEGQQEKKVKEAACQEVLVKEIGGRQVVEKQVGGKVKKAKLTDLQRLIKFSEENASSLSDYELIRLTNLKERQAKLNKINFSDLDSPVPKEKEAQLDFGQEGAQEQVVNHILKQKHEIQLFRGEEQQGQDGQEVEVCMGEEELQVQGDDVVEVYHGEEELQVQGDQEVEVCSLTRSVDEALFQYERISVFSKDYESVADPEGWLTDQVVDFWTRFQIVHELDPLHMSSVTIFTSDFFHFLTRAYSSDQVALGKWTKHSDLFRTIIVAFHIVTHNHW